MWASRPTVGRRRSVRERRLSGGTDVPTLNLSSEQAEPLAQVLEDYVSDLRMEVADTDSQEFPMT
jgi:hypothetical protein